MFKYPLKHILFFGLSVFLLSACSRTEPLSDVFKSAIDDFITAGSKLNAATGQGVSYLNYRDYYAEVGGAYELALASWPENFAPDAKEQFTKALWGWDLTGVMWEAKIQDEEILASHPRFNEFEQYGGDLLAKAETRIRITDDNIGLLLALASEQFEAGRDLLLPLLQ